MKGVESFFTNIANSFGSVSLPENYFKAGSIVALVFVFILITAYFGRFVNKSTIKGIFVGIFFGFLLTLTIEGFLLVSGHTALTGLLGWNNAPKPISTVLDIGKEKLTDIICSP